MAVKAGEGSDDVMAEINITPFTDVLLVLLIIFMLAATAVVQSGFNINLPKAVARVEANNENIIVTIAKGGATFVGSRAVPVDDLTSFLKRLKQARHTDQVIIMADGDTPYAKVIQVMDKAKAADLTQIALATTPKESGSK